MFSFLVAYIKNIAVFMIFASVIEIAEPRGSFSGLLRFFKGLLLILLVLRPIGELI